MRLRVTLLHDGSNADVEASLTYLWRAIPAQDVDVNLVTLDRFGALPGLRTLRGLRDIEPFLNRDRADVIHAWLARPALLCGLLRLVPDRPVVITGVPGTVSRLENEPLAAAAHISGAFLSDLVTVWRPATRDWLVRNGVPSDAIEILPDLSVADDPDALARRAVRLYDEAVARRRPIWRRFVGLPRL